MSNEMRDLERRWRETFGTDLFRPRDEFDVDVEAGSVRGRALALMDEAARVHAQFEAVVAAMPWYRRWPTRAVVALSMAWFRFTQKETP